MTAHFPFLCESRSKWPPSSSAWSWGSTSSIWEGEKVMSVDVYNVRTYVEKGTSLYNKNCTSIYLHYIGHKIRKHFEDFDLLCIFLQKTEAVYKCKWSETCNIEDTFPCRLQRGSRPNLDLILHSLLLMANSRCLTLHYLWG